MIRGFKFPGSGSICYWSEQCSWRGQLKPLSSHTLPLLQLWWRICVLKILGECILSSALPVWRGCAFSKDYHFCYLLFKTSCISQGLHIHQHIGSSCIFSLNLLWIAQQLLAFSYVHFSAFIAFYFAAMGMFFWAKQRTWLVQNTRRWFTGSTQMATSHSAKWGQKRRNTWKSWASSSHVSQTKPVFRERIAFQKLRSFLALLRWTIWNSDAYSRCQLFYMLFI